MVWVGNMSQAASRCSTVVDWLSSAIVPNLQKMHNLPFTDAEALVELMAHFPQKAIQASSDFRRLVVLLCQSNIAGHPHQSVDLAFIEMVLRYSILISQSRDGIRAVLASLLGPRGMKHPRYQAVRSRRYIWSYLVLSSSLLLLLLPSLSSCLSLFSVAPIVNLNTSLGCSLPSCYCLRKLLRTIEPATLAPLANTILAQLAPVAQSSASNNFGYEAGGNGHGASALVERDYMSVFEMIGAITSNLPTATAGSCSCE